MKKRIISWIIIVVFPASIFAQNAKQSKDILKGFDFFFNAGMYLGSKANANFYRGLPDPVQSDYADPSINYVLWNKYWRDEILNLIASNHREIIADDFTLEGLDEMRYNLAFSFGIGARYRLSDEFVLSLLFAQARLTAQGFATIGVKGTGVNLDKGMKYLDYPLIGKERRSFFEFNVAYLFSTTSPYVFPFIELGAHINSVKVLSSDIIIEEHPYSLINWHGEGTIYDPSISQTEIDPHLGGVGFGFMGGLGLRLAFNKWAAIEPVVQINIEKVNLSSYGKMRPNFNFMVRLVVGDKVFAKKK
jgi:hypothetical protein